MKELSIEEKAKRYDELKVTAQELEHDGCFDKITLFDLFPELKESEGEKRIPKEIEKYLKEKGDFRSCWIAWLEKQCEKESVTCPICGWDIEKQGEQKPAWSEEDEKIVSEVIQNYESGFLPSVIERDRIAKTLKSLKDRVQPQPKQEWGEEDESILQGIWDEILANKHNAKEYEWKTYDKFLNWLKSLEERYTWKPSDEQIKALQTVYDWYKNNLPQLTGMQSLFNDLSKLKG